MTVEHFLWACSYTGTMAVAAGLLPFWIHTEGEGGGTLNLVSPLRSEGFANVTALKLYNSVR